MSLNPNPYATSSILESIQASCAQQLLLQPNISASGCPVLVEYLGDVEFTLLRLLQGGATVVIVVSSPYASRPQQNTPTYWERINVRATVIEAVTQNEYTGGIVTGTGISGTAFCEYVCLAWNPTGKNFSPLNGGSPMTPDDPNIHPPKNEGDGENFPNVRMQDVSFFTSGGIQQLLQQFDNLVYTQTGNSLAISVAKVSGTPVAGAPVFYSSTTDGTNPPAPTPLNSLSPQTPNSLYTGPITVVTGQKIRASPWLPGYLSPSTGAPIFTCA